MRSTAAPERVARPAELTPHRSRHFVSRSRVRECLADAATSQAVIVTGPPGAGKTLAIADWATTTNRNVAWAALEPEDTEPGAFWHTLLTAVQCVVTEFGAGWHESVFDARIDDSPVRAFVTDAGALTEPLLLVIDDLHVVDHESVYLGLERLVEHLPDSLQLVMASRVDPPLPLARWRARGTIGEVRQRDLAFRVDEVAAFFATFPELRLDAEEIELLAERTEGWAAALQLGALALSGHEDPHAQVLSLAGSTRMIADFLVTEVLDRLSPERREFLMALSVLDRFDVDLCRAITGCADSGDLLRELEKSNMFLVPLDGAHEWYRFHQLFAQLLRHELDARTPERSKDLHLAAARHLDERGDLGTAVQHYLAGGDIDQAFRLSATGATQSMRRGPDAACFVPIPAEFLEDDADRMLTYASAVSWLGRHDEAAAWLRRAERRAEVVADAALGRRLDGLWAAHYGLLGDADRALPHGERAMAAAHPGSSLESATLALCLAQSQMLVGDTDGALRSLATIEPVPSENIMSVALPALSAHARLRQGELTAAEQLVASSLSGAEALGAPDHGGTFNALLARAGLLMDQNRLDEAEAASRDAVTMAEGYGYPLFIVLAHVKRARLIAWCRSAHDALDHLGHVRARLAHQRPGAALLRYLDGVEARYYAEVGDLDRARSVLDGLTVGPARSLLEARIAVLAGDREAVTTALAAAPLTSRRERLAGALLLVRALATDGRDAAREHAMDAARLAAPERLVGPILEEGADVARLVRTAAEDACVPVLDRLAAELGAPAPVRAPVALVEPLSRRELSVLRYLPTRMTNQDIAVELYVSLNTVKTHIKAIYRKLGASSRAEAVLVARQHGALGPQH